MSRDKSETYPIPPVMPYQKFKIIRTRLEHLTCWIDIRNHLMCINDKHDQEVFDCGFIPFELWGTFKIKKVRNKSKKEIKGNVNEE